MSGTSRRRARLLIGGASLLAYFAGFSSNFWGAASQGWFLTFQRGSECHVLGRLVKSRQDGVFSAGGLLGVGVTRFEGRPAGDRHGIGFRRNDLASGIHLRGDNQEWPAGEQVDQQYHAYVKGARFEVYSPYPSQIGGQGMFYGVLDALLPFEPSFKLELFFGMAALLSAAAFAGMTRWFDRELSSGIALWVLISGLASQWLVGFGRNLWWGLWAFYLPFLAIGCYEAAPRSDTRRRLVELGALSFAAVLVKCFVNGYEYATTALLMLTVPCVYAAARDGVPAKTLLLRLGALAAGSTVAVATSLLILVAQLASLRDGNLRFGVRHIAFAFLARTGGAAEDFAPSYAAGLNASRWSVLETYLKGAYLEIGGVPLRYGWLFLGFAAASVLLLRSRRDRALLFATWYSALAPLSWLLIFKAHSYEHTHMNFVVWQMPFTLFGFAVIGRAAARLVARDSGSDA